MIRLVPLGLHPRLSVLATLRVFKILDFGFSIVDRSWGEERGLECEVDCCAINFRRIRPPHLFSIFAVSSYLQHTSKIKAYDFSKAIRNKCGGGICKSIGGAAAYLVPLSKSSYHPSLKSAHSGLIESISATFFSLR